MTSTEAKWSERVESWKTSGKSLEEFAEGQPFKASTLRWWSTELRRRNERCERESSRSIKMARVVRRRASMAPSGSGVAVEVSGMRVTVERGFDADLLAQVVRALGGGR